ncbi:MAG: chorismate mutase [Clostridia bacterium]|nr:chorismate mutase [Clostridia bacterium]
MNISDYREKIDGIDAELLRLFEERMVVASQIAEYKKANGLPVLDADRERAKILDIIDKSPESVREYSPILFSFLFELSRSYQNRLNGVHAGPAAMIDAALASTPKMFPDDPFVAVQGIQGANSQTACERLFKYPRTMYFSSFEAVFSAIEKGLCKYGVIPLENSNAGSVKTVYDLMMSRKFYIVRSVRLKIDHDLLVKPGTKLEDIREIRSHEQAIGQCQAFLGSLKNVKIVPVANTAIAAQQVAESDRSDIAALASSQCTGVYGLECLKSSVQDNGNNYTRFICISKNLEIFPGADRTSLMMTLPHAPGALCRVLQRFYALGINLAKLESRPLPGKDFEFMFYFDLDTPVYSPALSQLIGELPLICESFQYLGSYSEVI